MSTPIPVEELPGPNALPVIGNLLDIDAASPFIGLVDLVRQYGPIFRLVTPAGPRLILSGAELVDEVCDDNRFDKKVGGGLANLRKGAVGSGSSPPTPPIHCGTERTTSCCPRSACSRCRTTCR